MAAPVAGVILSTQIGYLIPHHSQSGVHQSDAKRSTTNAAPKGSLLIKATPRRFHNGVLHGSGTKAESSHQADVQIFVMPTAESPLTRHTNSAVPNSHQPGTKYSHHHQNGDFSPSHHQAVTNPSPSRICQTPIKAESPSSRRSHPSYATARPPTPEEGHLACK